MNKFWKFKDVDDAQWSDWQWQLKNRLSGNCDIRDYFPNMPEKERLDFAAYSTKFSFAITPYTLSLIELDDKLNPQKNDPIWNQFRFYNEEEISAPSNYNGIGENWETADEMPTRMLHHKYPDRAIIRLADSCFSYCNYCYLTARVLDKDPLLNKSTNDWQQTLDYLRETPQIKDVLLSGGDPLMLNNDRLDKIFHDLSGITSIESIRLNTRIFTFAPYRFDHNLALLFKKYRLTALEIQIVHPREINDVVDERLRIMDEVGYRPLILSRAPLLKDINDSEETLKELFLKLYRRRITPYYLFHSAPFTLGRSQLGLSVKKGSRLLQKLRREIPGPAMPRYTLFHIEGKHDIPLDPEGSDTFIYTRDDKNNPIVKFKNWKNHWVTYPDLEDSE